MTYQHINNTTTCINCGEEITYDEWTGYWMHDFGRWEKDNGYRCYKNKSSIAKPKLHQNDKIIGLDNL
ncbi:MAG: hypothetical protein H8E98_03110 [Bacteroidetes bacterium]|nr:hypothetical protein [Bacteroidota bacterium]